MSNNILRLKSINDLLEDDFFIPAYQRGYRWTTQQVEDLLTDLWEFTEDVENDKNKGFYCLQPIVVKKNFNNNKWDVIDGQQRLTTIYIILKSVSSILQEMGKNPYSIQYETRDTSGAFLQTKLEEIDKSNIDFFHMSKAYEIIKQWFETKSISKYKFIDRLLTKDGKNVRVIWYEVNQNAKNDIEIFTRINMGKIPLTNAELVKALLLENFEKQFELASQWDYIEYELRNDAFWLFINKENNEKATRIEFIFELIVENYLKIDEKHIQAFRLSLNKSIDPYYVFHIVNYMIKTNMTSESIWEQVHDYYRILNEWYEDREYFHKIGFLVTQGEKEHTVLNFINQYKKEDKEKFTKFLNSEINQLFNGIKIDELDFERDKRNIKKVLLMFNIQTIINNKDSNMRFQFDRFKKDNWDIEHIRSQTDKYPIKREDKAKWIQDILPFVTLKKTVDEILNMEDDQFINFYKQIYTQLETSTKDDFNKHSIGNLALLDSGTNRSYGNAFFPVKRKIILENDMNGTFIPICTKNVFMKYYTEDVVYMKVWEKVDADDYTKKINKILKPYFIQEQLDEQY